MVGRAVRHVTGLGVRPLHGRMHTRALWPMPHRPPANSAVRKEEAGVRGAAACPGWLHAVHAAPPREAPPVSQCGPRVR